MVVNTAALPLFKETYFLLDWRVHDNAHNYATKTPCGGTTKSSRDSQVRCALSLKSAYLQIGTICANKTRIGSMTPNHVSFGPIETLM